MSVKTYSKAKNGSVKLSAHFCVSEFACPNTDTIKIDTDLVDILERLFAYLGCSKIIVTSGSRTASHDKQVGGDGKGYHTKGQAVDINCYYVKNGKETRYHGSDVCCALQSLGWTHGIGWIAGCAVHVDTRSTQYWFDEQNGNRSIGTDWYAYMKKKGHTVAKPVAGDVDGNGKVDANDALVVLQSTVNNTKLTEKQKATADVNGDGKVNSTDALEILQKATK